MPPFREHFEGLWLGGTYLLRQCLEESGPTAYFLAGEGENGRAIVRLDRAGDAAAARSAVWERLAAIPHPNVIRVLRVGEVEAGGIRAAWAALEYPEENVGDVLRTRALTAEEAAAALTGVADALAHLHAHGLVLGELTPWSVVAAGDVVKVPADGAREAGASTPDGDVRALGLTACEMLTRRVPEMADGAPRFTPEEQAAIGPFETFIRRCLEGRWAAARLAAYLRNPEREAEDEARLPEPPRMPEPAAPPLPPPAGARVPAQAARHSSPRVTPVRRATRAPWVWAAAALCAVVLVALLLAVGREHEAAAPPPAAVPAERPQPVPANAHAGTPAPSTAVKWRVVAYTYRGLEAARKKARSVNDTFPQFQAEVFAPRGEGPPYLVTLGGRMTREEAVELQRAARRKGLPRDTYVRNYRN